MAKKIGAALAVFFPLLLGGCALRDNGRLQVLEGVIAWSRQDWAQSASAFLASVSGSGGDEPASADGKSPRDYAVYGLASTYLAQDEYDPALVRLASIRDSRSTEIRASVWYQAGIIAYRRGEFDEAALCFKKSLENDPSSSDAKINLELSKKSLVERESRTTGSSSGFSDSGEQNPETEMIFSLVRKKEQDRWKNQDEDTVKADTADY